MTPVEIWGALEALPRSLSWCLLIVVEVVLLGLGLLWGLRLECEVLSRHLVFLFLPVFLPLGVSRVQVGTCEKWKIWKISTINTCKKGTKSKIDWRFFLNKEKMLYYFQVWIRMPQIFSLVLWAPTTLHLVHSIRLTGCPASLTIIWAPLIITSYIIRHRTMAKTQKDGFRLMSRLSSRLLRPLVRRVLWPLVLSNSWRVPVANNLLIGGSIIGSGAIRTSQKNYLK